VAAEPGFLAERERDAEGEGGGHGEPPVGAPEGDVDRAAVGAVGLLEGGFAVGSEGFGDGLVEELGAGFGVGGFHLQADAADEVRDLPVEADEVFIAQIDGDAGGFQHGTSDDGFGKVAILPQGDELALDGFVFVDQGWLEIAAGELGAQGGLRGLGERVVVAGEGEEFRFGGFRVACGEGVRCGGHQG
jgi:hypothetical protein